MITHLVFTIRELSTIDMMVEPNLLLYKRLIKEFPTANISVSDSFVVMEAFKSYSICRLERSFRSQLTEKAEAIKAASRTMELDETLIEINLEWSPIMSIVECMSILMTVYKIQHEFEKRESLQNLTTFAEAQMN